MSHNAAMDTDAAIAAFAIDVEKLLLAKLGRPWTPGGISIASLVDELGARAALVPDELTARCLATWGLPDGYVEAFRQGYAKPALSLSPSPATPAQRD